MNIKRLVWLPVVLLAAACAPRGIGYTHPPVAAIATKTVSTPRTFPTVQAIVDAAVRDGRIPGISVAVGVGDAPTTFISAGRLTLETGAPATEHSLWPALRRTLPVA